MLRKTLLLTACFCILSAPLVHAGAFSYDHQSPSAGYYGDSRHQNGASSEGLCYAGLNGHGEVIKWAYDKNRCQNQSSGQSWAEPGHIENFYREGK